MPGAGDTALIGSGDHPFVPSSPPQVPDAIEFGGTGRIVFQNGATLTTDEVSANSGAITGEGTLVVNGEFSKGTDEHFSVTSEGLGNAPDLVLNGPATMGGGTICVGRDNDFIDDQPRMHINATFTLVDDPNPGNERVRPFSCTSGQRIVVNPSGHLIATRDDPIRFGTMIQNDGTFTVETGQVILEGGNISPGFTDASDGDYVAEDGATLQFGTCCAEQFEIGSSGRVGGAGTIVSQANPLTLADGATLDPAVLNLPFASLVLNGSGPAPTLPVVNMTGGHLDTDRAVTATTLNVTSGSIRGAGSVTVPTGGSFSKTTDGGFGVTANLFEAAADLNLNVDATLAGGLICVTRSDDSHPDNPNLNINRAFVVGAGAANTWYACSGGRVRVNGPNGHFSSAKSGTTFSHGAITVDGGTLSVASGQTLQWVNGVAQSGGLTEVASGGVLSASPTLTGGVLRGAGQVSGHVTNSGGRVEPGGSPGALTVTGNYTQGANGVLEIDVNGTAQGTQFDHLDVGGAASLDGTVAVVKGPGFDPQLSDTFQFLTSGSRTGGFSALVGSRLPSGKSYSLEDLGNGARLTVLPPGPSAVSEPTLTDTDPDSLADDNQPEVKGTAPAGSTVALYTSADCSGSPAAVGSAASFASPGLSVSVPDESITTFRATATQGNDTSPCSASELSYVEDSGPADVVVGDGTLQADLDALEFLRGDFTMDNADARGDLVVPNLELLGGDLSVTDNDSVEVISMAELGSVAGELTITDNPSAQIISMAELGSVAGELDITGNAAASEIDLSSLLSASELTITDNGNATVAMGAGTDVAGNLTLESTGTGTFAMGDGSVAGELNLDLSGYDAVTGVTASGATSIEVSEPDALMRADLPSGAFTAPVPFTLTRLAPNAVVPQPGTGADGGATVIDPVAGYQLGFDVPTLNQDATLTFDLSLDALDAATRAELLTALAAGTATLATKGDAPGGSYGAFPLCAGGAAPSDGGCVTVERLDGDGQPTTGTPKIVRFKGVTGHFSSWAVVLVKAPAGGEPNQPGNPSGPGNSGTSGDPDTPPAFGAHTAVTLKLVGRRASARGAFAVRVTNANAFPVAGRLGGRVGRLKLRAEAFEVPAQGARNVRLRLSKPMRRALRRRGRLALRMSAAVRDPAGNTRSVGKRIMLQR